MKPIVGGPCGAVHYDVVKRNDLPPYGIVESECVFRDAICVLGGNMADGDVSLSCTFFIDVVCSSAGLLSESGEYLNLPSLYLPIHRLHINVQ